jgi:hypothetical protein
MISRLPVVLLPVICSFLSIRDMSIARASCQMFYRATNSAACLGPALPGLCNGDYYAMSNLKRFPLEAIKTRVLNVYLNSKQYECPCKAVPISLTSGPVRHVSTSYVLHHAPIGCTATTLQLGSTIDIQAGVFTQFPFLRRLRGGILTSSVCDDHRFGSLHSLQTHYDHWHLFAGVRFICLVFLGLSNMGTHRVVENVRIERSMFPVLTKPRMRGLRQCRLTCDHPLDIMDIDVHITLVSPVLAPIEWRMLDVVSPAVVSTCPLIASRLRVLKCTLSDVLQFVMYTAFPVLETLHVRSGVASFGMDLDSCIAPRLTTLSVFPFDSVQLCVPPTVTALYVQNGTVEFLPHQRPVPQMRHINLRCPSFPYHRLPSLFPNVHVIDADDRHRAPLSRLVALQGSWWNPHVINSGCKQYNLPWHASVELPSSALVDSHLEQ